MRLKDFEMQKSKYSPPVYFGQTDRPGDPLTGSVTPYNLNHKGGMPDDSVNPL